MALHMLSPREVQVARDGFHDDGGGLFLRVKGPNASWVLRYTSGDGRRRAMGLGQAHRDSLAAAGESLTLSRSKARKARDDLAAGRDPIDQKRAERVQDTNREAADRAEKKAEALTLCRAARGYHERVIEPKWSDKHAKLWIASLENNVSYEIWHKRIDAIGHLELLEVLGELRLRIPESSDKITQRLSTIFDDAVFYGHCTTNPIKILRRKLSELPRGREEGHYRAMPYAKVPAVVEELRKLQATAARALEFTILTAARTGEALGAVWSEMDEIAGVWRIPAARMKAREDHIVHLPPRALEILSEMRERQGGEFVFPSPVDRMRGMSNMAMLVLLDRLKIRGHTTVHGFRAAFSTWANETGVARPDVVEACLAHRETDLIRAAYNRAGFFAERAALLRAWASYCDGTPASEKDASRPKASVVLLTGAGR